MKANNPFVAMSALPLVLIALNNHADSKDSEVTQLENVLVIGESTSVSTDQLAGSYDVIGRDELDYEHPDDTYELFDKAPGVSLSRYNQGIINTDVAIRGFAGDGVTPHSKLLVDGIPFNLNNGYGELDQLFPLDIQSIEVYRGASDARYGLFNLAGNYNVTSRRDLGTDVKVTVGSFNTKELQLYSGVESGKLNVHSFVGYRQADGYRDHTDIEKLELSNKLFYRLGDDSEVGLSLRHSTYEADSPGYLTQAESRANPTSSASYASEDGGDKDINHISLHYDKRLSDSVKWTNKVYLNDIDRSRWVRFFQTSTLQNRVDDQQQKGFITTFDWAINDQWTLDFGADIEKQDVVEQRFNHPGQTRSSRRTVNRDRAYTVDSTGVFATLEQTPSDFLRWNVGLRLDRLDGDRTDNNGEIYDYGTIAQPKANVFVTPSDDVTVFFSYGRSFQHLYGSSAYTTTDVNFRDVSTHDAWELGSKWYLNDAIELRASYWQHEAEDEFLDLDGFQQIVGDTERRGIDLGANIAVTDRMDVWLNYGIVDSEITNPYTAERAANAGIAGNELRSIPEYTASIGTSYDISSQLTGRIHVDSQGDYYVNEENVGGKFGGYTIVNASIDYDASWGNLNFQINNLFDEFYEYVYDFTSDGGLTVHSPGDGINASLTYSYGF